MRITPLLTIAVLTAVSCANHSSLTDAVNPFIGATTSIDAAGVYHGLGKTFPGAATPFGMTQVNPNTVTGGDNAPGYSYEMETIEGFSMLQMSGTGWYGEFGNFLVMPTHGPMHTTAGLADGSVKGWRSRYDKAAETASLGYYSTVLTDYGIRSEVTASPHGGVMRFTFPAHEVSRIQVDLARRVGGTAEMEYARIVGDRSLEGWMHCTPACGGWGNGEGGADYTLHFHAEFSKPFTRSGFWSADIPDEWVRKRNEVVSPAYLQRVSEAEILPGVEEIEGKHIGFFAEFPTTEGEAVCVSVALSFTDLEGARRNFQAELEGKSFDEIHAQAVRQWEQELGRIEIDGGTPEERTVFYTALYHTMIDPRIASDVDGRYIGGDRQVHEKDPAFRKRTVFSGWDVFRSQMPLYALIWPEVNSDLIHSLMTLAEESGREYYERWEIVNSYSGCMLGNPALSVIADAWAKGIRTFDLAKAYDYARRSSEVTGNGPDGFTPGSLSVSHTFEYAYGDWCISRMAEALGDADGKALYETKAGAWRNLYDPEFGWFRPRSDDGSWVPAPEAGRTAEWYGCIECNPFQQGWFVPHDPDGLFELLGGKEKALAELEEFFGHTPLDFRWNQYYNHANEPVHFVPFLFNALGKPSQTQKWTRTICRNAYSNAVEGICGNEDCGQMSAWYILAAAGLHPSCPGNTVYQITSPVFDRIRFRLPGGDFTVIAHGNGPKHVYIRKAALNGKPLHTLQIDHSDLVAGGRLELWMSPEPHDSLD